MKKLLIVGRSHLRYFALALQEDGKFEVNHLRIHKVFDFVEKHGENIAVVINELGAEHGKELEPKETHDGELTGAILTEKLLPLCPNATFFVFGSDSLPRLQKKDRVVPLRVMLDITPTELVSMVNKHKSR